MDMEKECGILKLDEKIAKYGVSDIWRAIFAVLTATWITGVSRYVYRQTSELLQKAGTYPRRNHSSTVLKTYATSSSETLVYKRRGQVFPVHATKAYRWIWGIAPLSSKLCTRWRWDFDLTLRPLYLRGKNAVAHRTGGRGGPKEILDVLEDRKVLCP
jgi:hypothetical protein